MPNWQNVATVLVAAGIHIDQTRKPVSVGGGDISAAWRIATSDGAVFLKTGAASDIEMFSAERDALAVLAAGHEIRVPAPLALGSDGKVSLLALQWLELGGATPQTGRRLGRALASLHRVTAAEFGWPRSNFIGATPQPNKRNNDWPDFFREQRLRFQLDLAARQGHRGELQTMGAWVCDNLAALFDNYRPAASLLHGDLWGGNWAACDGEPVIFDPASYYGDRETDLAMTRLFGGFPPEFYTAYEQSWPLAPGAADRVPLYQLYHVLNHLNLFGEGYAGKALGLMRDIRSAIEG